MSKLEQITSFITVAEENSFAAAARKKNISTAAISRQIGCLEKTLRVQLLHRTTRQISLTDIGAQYYQHCKNTLRELTEAENAIRGSQAEAIGILHIISSRYFAVHYLLPRLQDFMHSNPKLQIKFELAERFPDFTKEGIDILFGMSIEGPPTLVRRRVLSTRYILCASPDYLKNHGIPETPSDLSKHRYITHTIRNPDNVIYFKDNKEIYIEPILWLNDNRAMRECAIKGMGIVRLHDYIIADAIEAGDLIEVLPEFQTPSQSVYLYYQQSRYVLPKIRRFIDFYIS